MVEGFRSWGKAEDLVGCSEYGLLGQGALGGLFQGTGIYGSEFLPSLSPFPTPHSPNG